MKEYQAQATIHASADTIWAILIDASAYPEWDPYCDKIEGRIALGEKIKAFSKLSPGRAFPVKVTEMVPNQSMIWSGGMPFGLFKGVRTFTLTPEDSTSTTVTLREVFSGPFLVLIGGSIPDMSEAFEKFVAGLKSRAETPA